jgi:hypothetical protein
MIRKGHRLLAIGFLIVAGMLLTSCTKATGGGWITSATGVGKATFGFTGKCRDLVVNSTPTAEITARLEYHDHPAGVSFHGVVPAIRVSGSTCAELQDEFDRPGDSVFTGSYQPQPKGAAGVFMLRVGDAGEPGRTGDLFCVSLIDGAYDAYRNCGALGGGNIQVH